MRETSDQMRRQHGNRFALRAHLPRLILLSLLLLGGFFGAYQVFENLVLAPRLDARTLSRLHLIRGLAASVILAIVVGSYIVKHQAGLLAASGSESHPPLFDRDARRRQYLRWFIQMRWIAAGVTLALILISVVATRIVAPSSAPMLFLWWMALLVSNLLFSWFLLRGWRLELQMVLQVLSDLVILTGFLNASGGLENPLWIAYVFHVIIAGIVLPARKVFGIIVAASALVLTLAFGEYFRILPHSTILLFPHDRVPAQSGAGHGAHGEQIRHASYDPMFVSGKSLSFVAVLFLTGYFTTMVVRLLRDSESELEQLAGKALLQHRRLDSVIESAGLGVAVVGRDLSIDWMNDRASGWLGWAVPGSSPHEHDSPPCVACLVQHAIDEGHAVERERSAKSGKNGSRWLRLAVAPIRDRESRIVQAVVLMEDITERKALEAEALHAGKLSVLGQMAAGIAHEIGNPLSSLDARLHLMKLRKDDASYIDESLRILREQIERIRRIVHGVSHFSAKRADGWTTWDLNQVVDEAVKLVQLDRRSKGIEFRARLDPRLPPLRGVRDHVTQVAVNLLLNAVEAMDGSGAIEVRTFSEGGAACFAVKDTGAGIDEETSTHLFEPFFTTRREGTGLGLSICYSLIHAHGGTIEVHSQPNEGAEFVVRLPLTVHQVA